MPVSAGDVCLVTLVGDLAGSIILNTSHYAATPVTGTPSFTAFAIEMTTKLQSANNLVAEFLSCCPPAYTLNEMWIQFISPTRQRKSVFAIGSPGTFAQDATTANLASVVTRAGATANKHNIGSFHVPYPNKETGASPGSISGALGTQLDLLAALLSATQVLATLGSIVPVLFFGNVNANASPIVSAFKQTTIRTMRRRTKGIGK